MKMTRAIEMNGTILNVSGNYKKILDPEGPIAEQETFDIDKIIDDELDVTDLFTDYYKIIEKEVIAVISSEDPADYPGEDDDIIEQETLDALKDIFGNSENINYELNDSGEHKLETSVHIPIYFEDKELSFDDMVELKSLVDNLKNVINNEENPIIAAKVSSKGIRLVTLSDLKDIS